MYHVAACFDVRPEHRADFIAAALEDARNSLADPEEPGTRRFELIVDENDKNRFYLNEAYDDAKAFDKHVENEHYRRFFELIAGYVAGPFDLIRGASVSDEVFPAARIHHVGVPVRNLEKSLEWYSELFGAEPMRRGTASGAAVAEMVGLENAEFENAFLDFGNTLVELLEYRAPVGEDFQLCNCDVGAIHVCFEVDDIAATYQELSEKGAKFNASPVFIEDGPWRGHRWCYFRDPDGIQFELWQRPKGL